jgi:hypothetical protein
MNDLLPEGCYVVLHIGIGPSHIEEKTGPPLAITSNGPFSLNSDIWIERLDERIAKNIQKACEPPHFNVDTEEYDRHLYAFVRRVPAVEKRRYEGLEELFAVIALSRLIHPTSIGYRYCVRVFHFGLKDSAIQAIQYRGISPDVFLGSKHRDWLSVDDAENLHKLMPWVSVNKPMHARIHRAYWNHEYAMRSYYLDMRWTLIVSGLEALINVWKKGKNDNKTQFCGRVRLLADEFKVRLSDDELTSAWRLRSKLAHNEGFLYDLDATLPKNQHDVVYEKLEDLLRMTLRQCLVDENFGNRFRDDIAVETSWTI